MPNLQRVRVQEAADLLHVSASTVRRRIAAGVLQSERERLALGSRLWVYLPQDIEALATNARTTVGDSVSLQAQIELLQRLLLNEQQAGAELRQLLGREQAAHQATLAAFTAVQHSLIQGPSPSSEAADDPPEAAPPKKHHNPVSWLLRAVTGMPID